MSITSEVALSRALRAVAVLQEDATTDFDWNPFDAGEHLNGIAIRRHPRAKKPRAIARLRVSRRHWTNVHREVRPLYKASRSVDRYGRMRAYILRPGRFFYCQECGARLSADQTVLEVDDRKLWVVEADREPPFISCLPCARAAGLDVWTYERRIRRNLLHTWAEDGIRYYQ